MKIFSKIQIVLIVLLVGAAFLIGSMWTELRLLKQGKGQQAVEQVEKPEAGGVVEVSVDDDPVLGDKDALVTIIEFSDYECPFCKRHFDEVFSQLKEKYIDTGKVKLVYRDLPLGFHDPMATKEAVAANCAREQGGDEKYFEYHDEIFERTISNGNGLNDQDLETIAGVVGLNLGEFGNCLEDESQEAEVKKDLADAAEVGATGTPTFFIGKSSDGEIIEGEKLVGAQPFSAFEAVINKYLE